jgi:SAM-dependent methyltransferase
MSAERGTDAHAGSVQSHLQEGKYAFPYHYIPHFDNRGIPFRSRRLAWSFDYLCYVRHIRELVVSLAPTSVLEVGCGDGRVIGLVGPTVSRCVGVDTSEQAVRFARAFQPDIEFHTAPAEELDESFDLVLAVEVLEHIGDDAVTGFIRTLQARTRPGGHVLISVPSTVLPLNPKHYRHYDAGTLTGQFASSGAGLELLRLDHVSAPSRLLRLYDLLTMCRHWFVEISFLNRLLWQHVWRRCRVAREGRGQHLVALFRKRVVEEDPGG